MRKLLVGTAVLGLILVLINLISLYLVEVALVVGLVLFLVLAYNVGDFILKEEE